MGKKLSHLTCPILVLIRKRSLVREFRFQGKHRKNYLHSSQQSPEDAEIEKREQRIEIKFEKLYRLVLSL
jgi:hypothetical protein